MLTQGEKPAFFVIKGFVGVIFCGDENNAKPLFYMACPSCKKKVIDEGDKFNCERCNQTFDNATPTYNFSVKISDFTDSHIFNLLGEAGDAIIGIPAQELYKFHED